MSYITFLPVGEEQTVIVYRGVEVIATVRKDNDDIVIRMNWNEAMNTSVDEVIVEAVKHIPVQYDC